MTNPFFCVAVEIAAQVIKGTTMTDTETFIKLKYEFQDTYPEDLDDWDRIYDTYPKDVTWAWNWKCAQDVEHLATTKKAKECIAYAKSLKHKKGDLTDAELEKLNKSWKSTNPAGNPSSSASYAAAACANPSSSASALAYYAAATSSAYSSGEREEKWKQYQGWLKEMLIEYEEQQ
jgi:Tfp pilus tip-associated adhesin PilY1